MHFHSRFHHARPFLDQVMWAFPSGTKVGEVLIGQFLVHSSYGPSLKNVIGGDVGGRNFMFLLHSFFEVLSFFFMVLHLSATSKFIF